ncbi:uncharacterized protein MYCFIDRAFT_216349 [Pseudocercospora fijiensis CIRAD86]|uniref:PWI domain-containing protein n=1 Tax=Pseudocercospora fijiensis (strain CIRAD86) TaxID=383855 RepID=M2ZJ81_PSEFD|nr:uncharacterized protein MYCFIDRAFT_216349 [Pseudocercospora fijiensis CIRAD86]EME79154.1 hypothetical protein MYCFIDRAFT_216349 [Pseudocercospora fijiensis CIRAD86]
MPAALKTGADARAMRMTKYPDIFNKKVDMTKVNLPVIKKWVSDEIAKILNSDDDVVTEMIFTIIEGSKSPNIKQLQTDITGFLDKDAAPFCLELWKLCLSAQDSPNGIPKELLEAKKLELIQERHGSASESESVASEVEAAEAVEVAAAIVLQTDVQCHATPDHHQEEADETREAALTATCPAEAAVDATILFDVDARHHMVDRHLAHVPRHVGADAATPRPPSLDLAHHLGGGTGPVAMDRLGVDRGRLHRGDAADHLLTLMILAHLQTGADVDHPAHDHHRAVELATTAPVHAPVHLPPSVVVESPET